MKTFIGLYADKLTLCGLRIFSPLVATIYGIVGLFACYISSDLPCVCGPFGYCSLCTTPLEGICGWFSVICVAVFCSEHYLNSNHRRIILLRWIFLYFFLYFCIDYVHSPESFSIIKSLWSSSTIVGLSTIFLGYYRDACLTPPLKRR